MMKATDYATTTSVREESNQMSDVQFLFGKYEEATQKILRLSKELEDVKTRNMEHRARNVELTKCIEDLKYDIRDTRFAINATIAECLDENHQFKPTNKVTKQDLLNALQTISVLIN